MIRIELPPPILPRLRLHWHNAHSLFLRQSRHLREFADRSSATVRIWRHRFSASLRSRFDLQTRAAERQLARLSQFEVQYEKLVDLLCWAANDGVHTDRDSRYAELRAWMQLHYPALRPRLRDHCQMPSAPDPFETLYLPNNVDEVIHSTNGIEAMMQSRGALDAYRSLLESRVRRS